ncbi:cytochrome b/b6 domain-containing protein [Amphibiibacter pelophylacis]|uniref:Cytochrome b/b6 domain-containing protein n=1 Tax=Amphibiibacter pelophylacis TaxID=1799477 RepID=A0ACC6NYH5_9BURK
MNTATTPPRKTLQPLWLRAVHWINVLAVLVMILSGWRIYNASPIFSFSFPGEYTLGGWLGGAILWHFAAMWVLVLNGLLYLGMNLGTGRMRQRFFPLSLGGMIRDMVDALRGKLSHGDLSQYNQVQRVAYLLALADLVLLVLSGLAVWKPVQLSWITTLLGGFQGARTVHFVAMALLVAFIVVHVLMVVLVPRTLRIMIIGR